MSHRRAQKDARKQRTVPTAIDKQRVADAVHRAVCQVTGGDGSFQCQRYAHAGHMLLNHLGIETVVQAGSLGLIPDDPNFVGWLRYSPTDEDEAIAGHVWLAQRDATMIDFTARHYRRYAHDPDYTRTPPDYLWTKKSHEWAIFDPVQEAVNVLGELTPTSITVGVEAINQYEGRTAIRAVELFNDGETYAAIGLELVA
jgi:hypothetical protein